MENNTMQSEAEGNISRFYNSSGWETVNGVTEDAKIWEDLRQSARKYVSRCRLRVLRHIPDQGQNILDMASGPIQYEEYLEYSRNFEKRYCVDLSSKALEEAERKIGDHGVFLQGSFFDITLEENFFDCSISLHTIYHMDEDEQEEAIRKLIRVTKTGKPVIIVYSNPNSIAGYLIKMIRIYRKISGYGYQANPGNSKISGLYFYAHPLKWWKRFEEVAEIQILPWRSFKSDQQKELLPDNKVGEKMFQALYFLEEKFPWFFVNYFRYPMIILTKI